MPGFTKWRTIGSGEAPPRRSTLSETRFDSGESLSVIQTSPWFLSARIGALLLDLAVLLMNTNRVFADGVHEHSANRRPGAREGDRPRS
jgi:hypothetical protein